MPGSQIQELLAVHRASLGRRPDSAERTAEAKRLTALLNSHEAFSFGRIGDYDLMFLLMPDSMQRYFDHRRGKEGGTEVIGGPGLLAGQVGRLRGALERLSYLDLQDRIWKDNTLLDRLALNLPPGSHRNPDRETSFIQPTWMLEEFKRFCSGKRVLFCGAEAPLLEAMTRRDTYREAARDFWPDDCRASFLRPRDDGRDPGANLDLIKQDLAAAVKRGKIEVVFLSLGGAAKILCQEVAEELRVCTVDFGVCLRSLTYSGSVGYSGTRASHHVFLFRLPFDFYMDALEEAYPNLSAEAKLGKAHAQLLLELQEKETGWTHTAWEYDFSPENRGHFERGRLQYQQRYQHLFRLSDATRHERAAFLHFCGKHKLTKAGRRYFTVFRIKERVAWMVKGVTPGRLRQ